MYNIPHATHTKPFYHIYFTTHEMTSTSSTYYKRGREVNFIQSVTYILWKIIYPSRKYLPKHKKKNFITISGKVCTSYNITTATYIYSHSNCMMVLYRHKDTRRENLSPITILTKKNWFYQHIFPSTPHIKNISITDVYDMMRGIKCDVICKTFGYTFGHYVISFTVLYTPTITNKNLSALISLMWFCLIEIELNFFRLFFN